jgi:hypothetical protein
MSLTWYRHRLRAMQPGELALHVRRKLRQRRDSNGPPTWKGLGLTPTDIFPKLPDPSLAPPIVRERLSADVDRILKGNWRAFGHLPIHVDDPPQWQKDYLAGKNLETSQSAFKLDYRRIPDGADSKLIWELSRWFELARLAEAAYVLRDDRAARKCVQWLQDWVDRNPPFRGWNWVSALETGMRLIQFTWMDALLSPIQDLEPLREAILPAHVWHAWRYRSFGSSANNHLFGELAGLIVALVRWPALESVGPKLSELQDLWETEVLAQFAEDGGNREQALNYHLYSWELCFHTSRALEAAGREPNDNVRERLHRAQEFFDAVQIPSEPWDYGDSDDAFVVPLFAKSAQEWWHWFKDSESSPAIAYWCGRNESRVGVPEKNWRYFSETGIARLRFGDWDLRWDLSPLGYQSIAAHGHLDALHLSMWFKGAAVVIDPGTGAYFADSQLRTQLAGWDAHNGPHLANYDAPRRLGTFLWGGHHAEPAWRVLAEFETIGELALRKGIMRRRLAPAHGTGAWIVEDSFDGNSGELLVRWQFPPGAVVQPRGEGHWRFQRGPVELDIQLDAKNTEVNTIIGEATVSPGFRQTASAPYLECRARTGKACVLRTIFLAC